MNDEMPNMQAEQRSLSQALPSVDTQPDATKKESADSASPSKTNQNGDCVGCALAHAGSTVGADLHDEQCVSEHEATAGGGTDAE